MLWSPKIIARKMFALGPDEERHATHVAVAAVADAFIRLCFEEAAACERSSAPEGASRGPATREAALLARAGNGARATMVACHQLSESEQSLLI